MKGLTKALFQDRVHLSEKLAGPLAELLSEHGVCSTTEELRELILDESTSITFPKIIMRKKGDVAVRVTDATISGKAAKLRKLTTENPP